MSDIILDAGTRREYVHTGGSSGRPLVFPKTLAEESFIHEFFSRVDEDRERRTSRAESALRRRITGMRRPFPFPPGSTRSRPSITAASLSRADFLSAPWDAPGVAAECTVIAGAERFVRAFTLDCEAAGTGSAPSTPIAFLLPNGQYISTVLAAPLSGILGCGDRRSLCVERSIRWRNGRSGNRVVSIRSLLLSRSAWRSIRDAGITEGFGELLLTPLYPFQQGLPLIRYATGDLVAVPASIRAPPDIRRYKPLGRLYHAILPDRRGNAAGAAPRWVPRSSMKCPTCAAPRSIATPATWSARQGLGHAIYHMGRAPGGRREPLSGFTSNSNRARASDAARADAVRERFHVQYQRIVGEPLPDHVSIDVRFGPPPSQDLISHAP